MNNYIRAHAPNMALGATPVLTPVAVMGIPQPPIYPLVIGNNGGFMVTRSSPAQGACGVSGYPCKHPGVDVYGVVGTRVVAPEDGVVMQVADGASSPLAGYGPWVVILHGDSGLYHLLGHLNPATSAMAMPGMRFVAGQQIGTTSTANHTHWEVRKKAIPDFAHGESNATNNLDPLAWLRDAQAIGKMGPVLLLGAAGLLFWLLLNDE